MAAQDLHNNIKVTTAVAPYNPSATGTTTGAIIDRAGYENLEFAISSGAQTTTGITVTPVIKHGSVTGTLTSAADTDLFSTEAVAAAVIAGSAGASKVTKIGYKGTSRYVQCNLILAGATTGYYSAVAILSGARKAPVS